MGPAAAGRMGLRARFQIAMVLEERIGTGVVPARQRQAGAKEIVHVESRLHILGELEVHSE